MYPRLSWSSLQAYEDCPQRYLLNRQRKRKPMPDRIVLVGNVIHYVSEQLILGALPVDEIVEQAGRDYWRRVEESTTLGWSMDEKDEHEARVIQGAWRLAELFDEEFGSVSRDALQSEMRLLKFYQGWALEGYIDVVQMEGRSRATRIYDVKTGASHKAGQLAFYSVLAEEYFGVRPGHFAWIEPLGRGVVEVPVTDDEHRDMKDRIMAAVQGINAGEFQTKGFPSRCGWCSGADWCPAMSRARTGKLV